MIKSTTEKSDRLREMREARFKGQPTPKAPRLLKQAKKLDGAKRLSGNRRRGK